MLAVAEPLFVSRPVWLAVRLAVAEAGMCLHKRGICCAEYALVDLDVGAVPEPGRQKKQVNGALPNRTRRQQLDNRPGQSRTTMK